MIIKGSIAIAIGYFLFDKRLQEDAVYDALSEMNLPRPQAYEESPEGYLCRVCDDESVPAETRVKAAVLAGIFTGAKPHLGFLRSTFLMSSWERGMSRYRRDNPPSTLPDER